MVLMDIFGSSMEQEIMNGDTIPVDQSRKEILAGALYAIGIEGTIMVKRIEWRLTKAKLPRSPRAWFFSLLNPVNKV